MENGKMSEPTIVAQNGEPEMADYEKRTAWFRAQAEEAEKRGCKLARYSIHETIPHLVLFEAWEDRRAEQGEQRWALTQQPQA
jgi:hypothetical protein